MDIEFCSKNWIKISYVEFRKLVVEMFLNFWIIFSLNFRSSQTPRREGNVDASLRRENAVAMDSQNSVTIQPNNVTIEPNNTTNQSNNATVRNLLIDASDGPPSNFEAVMNLIQVPLTEFKLLKFKLWNNT